MRTTAPAGVLDAALARLRAVVEDGDAVAPTDDVRRRAGRLVAAHPLRAADALQLAVALTWCEEQPAGERFVCLDERLRDAARREGFTLVPE
jgi:predicted nucleic acid-binding protein